jgi:pimeloyl-ACP methyl ester carboxylesterase
VGRAPTGHDRDVPDVEPESTEPLVEQARGALEQDGNIIVYRDFGPADGPVVLLVHGMVSDSSTWTRAALGLAARGYRVIAPDLLGHGESSKPLDGGYSLPDFARSLRRLLAELDLGPVTLAGHSLGGAVAMQFAHDYPKLVTRLVLVSAGGLGRKVHPLFRAATLPGAYPLFRLALNSRTAHVLRRPGLHRSLRLSEDVVTNLGRAGRGLVTESGRTAFFHTLRNAINPSGQRGSMLDLDYVARALPTLIIWSAEDPIVPVEHAQLTHEHLPNSRLVVLPGASHQPHHQSADRFVAELVDFIATTP